MSFTRKKFLALDKQSRAKKIADLAASILELGIGSQSEIGTQSKKLKQYEQLHAYYSDAEETNQGEIAALLEQDVLVEQSVLGSNDWRRRIYDAYIFWCARAGHGPKKRLLFDCGLTGDRSVRLYEPLHWTVFLHNIRSGYNVGAIMRTAECFGFGGIVLSGYTPGPENRAVCSAAMGVQSYFPIQIIDDPIAQLEESGKARTIVALEVCVDAVPLAQMEWPEKGILLLGNEELGIDPALLELADIRVQIPLFGRKASLNVAQAFAVAAWELRSNK